MSSSCTRAFPTASPSSTTRPVRAWHWQTLPSSSRRTSVPSPGHSLMGLDGPPYCHHHVGDDALDALPGFYRLAVRRGSWAGWRAPVGLVSYSPLEQLAAGVAGQRVGPDDDVLRHLEVGDSLPKVVLDRLYVDAAAGRRHQHRPDLLAHHLVRHADHGCLEYARRAGKRVLHLDAVHVRAAPVDHVLYPVDDVDESVRVETGEGAGVQPAVDERLGSRLRLVPVAGD